jgi:hypothetical protein
MPDGLSPKAQFAILGVGFAFWIATPDLNLSPLAYAYHQFWIHCAGQIFLHFWPLVSAYFSIRMLFSKEWKAAGHWTFYPCFLLGFLPLAFSLLDTVLH